MDIQQRIHHQRVRHIIDSYMLMGTEAGADRFDAYVSDLLAQYPAGLIELAFVETLVKSWLSIPMQRGIAFLSTAHEYLKQWQAEMSTERVTLSVTPAQFSHITGLDPQIAFAALVPPAGNTSTNPTVLPTQALDSALGPSNDRDACY